MQQPELSEKLNGKGYIPASLNLPEITVRGIILAIILTIILAAANAYLGLKVGLTVSASIPAAVISMGVLRFFKNSNVLENNIVQTAASAGEALTAGVAYTLPALIVIHYWAHFNYFASMAIAMTGGILGVLFSVPLRRVLLADETLRFPEGTAIGKVLSASTDKTLGLSELVAGSSIGALISLFQGGFKLLSDSVQLWVTCGSTIIGGGLGFAPAMLGAGYIIGLGVTVSIFLGIVLGWLIGIPVIAYFYDHPAGLSSASDIAQYIWQHDIRYIGIGVMVIGGLGAIATLLRPMIKGIHASFVSVSNMRVEGMAAIPRTERDMKITTVMWCILALICPVYFIIYHFSSSPVLGIGIVLQQSLNWISVILVLFLGFVLASICAYFAGLVGSSANPLSSMALISLIIASFIFSLLLGTEIHLSTSSEQSIAAAAVAIIVTAIISSIASISNDTMQDLKAGQMVGATPWKQQIMLILGVIVAAAVIPLILQLLFDAYGFSGAMPRLGMDETQALAAPQAGLMAAVVQGIFMRNVPWAMMGTGSVIAILAMILDRYTLRKFGKRIPVLAIGIGIYLPIDTTMPLVIGGILSWVVDRALQSRAEAAKQGYQKGLLLASGLVAGSAVMGVVLAIPFVIAGSSNVLSLLSSQYAVWTELASIIVTFLLCVWFRSRVIKVYTHVC
ncbi:MAG: oligopeptide transporter, OPT family [Legionellales bacterium]|nr:oligopeptide transporter, OPT family [Legionellales bacterium]